MKKEIPDPVTIWERHSSRVSIMITLSTGKTDWEYVFGYFIEIKHEEEKYRLLKSQLADSGSQAFFSEKEAIQNAATTVNGILENYIKSTGNLIPFYREFKIWKEDVCQLTLFDLELFSLKAMKDDLIQNQYERES